jgi:hypothetical protein
MKLIIQSSHILSRRQDWNKLCCIVLTVCTVTYHFSKIQSADSSNLLLIFWPSKTVKRVQIRCKNIQYYR